MHFGFLPAQSCSMSIFSSKLVIQVMINLFCIYCQCFYMEKNSCSLKAKFHNDTSKEESNPHYLNFLN